jgi:hypothetical protein
MNQIVRRIMGAMFEGTLNARCCGWRPHEIGLLRSGIAALFVLASIAAAAQPGPAPLNPRLQTYFRENIGLSQNQIADIRNGIPVVKALPARTPAEVFLFGAVYIHAVPSKYIQFSSDLDRLRQLPNFMGVGGFGNPPRLSDLKGLSFESDDIQALRSCTPGDCLVQVPARTVEDLQRSIDWSAANASEQVNQFLRRAIVENLIDYQREGNQALGVYNDKRDAPNVAQQFAYLLSYDTALPAHLPDFYHYLLAYPYGRPANVEDSFYWAKVKFGLKPTLRVAHVMTMKGSTADDIAYAIADKQLYSSHYFETAISLTYCVRGRDDPKHPGFYLIMTMGSEQAGLSGIRGLLVRKVAIERSTSSLQGRLTAIKNALEGGS